MIPFSLLFFLAGMSDNPICDFYLIGCNKLTLLWHSWCLLAVIDHWLALPVMFLSSQQWLKSIQVKMLTWLAQTFYNTISFNFCKLHFVQAKVLCPRWMGDEMAMSSSSVRKRFGFRTPKFMERTKEKGREIKEKSKMK